MYLRRLLTTACLRPTIQQVLASPSGSPVEVHGWVRSIRKQKRVAFAAVGDGSCPDGLQAVLSPELAKPLTNGVSVRLMGKLAASRGAGQEKELQVEAVDILGECDPATYPIQKQALTTEYLREHVHLRTRVDGQQAILRLRDRATTSVHTFFKEHSFVHSHTPVLTANDCEGAGETFTLAPTNPSSPSDAPDHFFSTPAHLTVSAQLHLEALALALGRVYTLAPCFRAEPSQTGRHLAEFWMLEAEWCFVQSVAGLCDFTEALLRAVLRDVLAPGAAEPSLLQGDIGVARRAALQRAAEGETWPRMSYSDAVRELEARHALVPFEYVPAWGRPLQSEHERWLAEDLVGGPVFVTDYPAALKPFYMRANDDTAKGSETVACFDLLVPGIGELAGGSMREERLEHLEHALTRHGIDAAAYAWYVDLRRYGTAPHGGFGLGLERLVSWLAGADNVRECIPMPRWAGRMLL